MRFVLAACAALFGSWVVACSCAPQPPPKKALEQSTAVFLGEVTKIDEDATNRTLTVTVKVERWWKGGDAAELTVSTHKDGATCGYGFQKGTKYLVYAHGEKDKPLRASLCSRTATAKDAEKAGDFKELGEGTAPKKPEKK